MQCQSDWLGGGEIRREVAQLIAHLHNISVVKISLHKCIGNICCSYNCLQINGKEQKRNVNNNQNVMTFFRKMSLHWLVTNPTPETQGAVAEPQSLPRPTGLICLMYIASGSNSALVASKTWVLGIKGSKTQQGLNNSHWINLCHTRLFNSRNGGEYCKKYKIWK